MNTTANLTDRDPRNAPPVECPSHFACSGDCGHSVAAFRGAWFVTMGHPGFNTPANNRKGYATKAAALGTVRRYASKRA